MKLHLIAELFLTATLFAEGNSSALPVSEPASSCGSVARGFGSRGVDPRSLEFRQSRLPSARKIADEKEENLFGHNPNPSNNDSFSGYVGPGVYLIKNLQTGSYLDLWGGDNRKGAKIAGWPYNGADHQKWQVVEPGDGTLILINNGTGTIAAASTPGGKVSNEIAAPYWFQIRWDITRDIFLPYDGFPIRLVNEKNCEGLALPVGQVYGEAYTFPADKEYVNQGWYFDWVYDNRSSCSRSFSVSAEDLPAELELR